jgi:uncharacterized membrane protein YeaQ/YmgE (transglycosylase-associated protein family)
MIGGWVFAALGIVAFGVLGSIIAATVGAIVLLLILRAAKRAAG